MPPHLRLSTRRLQSLLPSQASTFHRPQITAPTLTCRRHFHWEGLALAPFMFGGLVVALYTWKCTMLVVFQNKIIYMPGLPPNARWERIEDYASQCGCVKWQEERVRAADGTNLALCVTDVDIGQPCGYGNVGSGGEQMSDRPDASLYILYFQGNASSIPPRLPDLSSALHVLKRRMHHDAKSTRVTFVCLSYRGYWTSRGRPKEKGIRLDAAAALRWISQQHEKFCASEVQSSNAAACPAEVLLWGQSIGSGVATNLAAEYSMPANLRLNSLIQETPFTSIRAMLEVLYPQKWLPYKHLWPFLRNHLDSWTNLGIISEKYKSHSYMPSIFILEAARDELVPAELSQKLYERSVEVGLPVEKKAVSGAFHNDAMFRAEGRHAVAGFIAQRIKNLEQSNQGKHKLR